MPPNEKQIVIVCPHYEKQVTLVAKVAVHIDPPVHIEVVKESGG